MNINGANLNRNHNENGAILSFNNGNASNINNNIIINIFEVIKKENFLWSEKMRGIQFI